MTARATASRIATAPRSTAEQGLSAEPNLPTGVLTAETITERVMCGACPPRQCRVGPQRERHDWGKGRTRMDTELLVIGAGPYALSTAALAQERGVDT
jgi:hypothetical protein